MWCEELIKKEFNESCNFDVDDAVQKLEKLGIVAQVRFSFLSYFSFTFLFFILFLSIWQFQCNVTIRTLSLSSTCNKYSLIEWISQRSHIWTFGFHLKWFYKQWNKEGLIRFSFAHISEKLISYKVGRFFLTFMWMISFIWTVHCCCKCENWTFLNGSVYFIV